ncbi:MAG: response regulator transcription factor [Chloroflexi bacterium]|nr:response regulator transcription factor [Chloroflexota bacterium]
MTGERPGHGERILVVEDEPEFAELTALWLERHGWQPLVAGDGREALRLLDAARPDLVLLDVGLPGLDGWGVVERIRERSQVPILFVTARDAEADKVRGLGLGADDYVTKPISFPELMARVGAALRRAIAWSGPDGHGREIRRPGLVIDLRSHQVFAEGRPVRLSPTEFRLLCVLAERPGEAITHLELLRAVWGAGYDDDLHVLRVTMRNLRARLAEAAANRRYVVTSYGVGYRFAPEAEVDAAGD